MWYSCEAGSAISDLRLVTAMSCPMVQMTPVTQPADDAEGATPYCWSWRLDFVFGAAAGALYYALQPVTLRIAVGPSGSDDHKLIVAAAGAFVSESSRCPVGTFRTCGQELQKKTAPKVQQIADLAGHRVGVIGLTHINVGQLLASLRQLNHRPRYEY